MSKRKTKPLRASEVSRCWFRRCKRPIEPGDKIVLMGMSQAPMHKRHGKHLNFVSRLRLWRAETPGIARDYQGRVDTLVPYARYELATNRILLCPAFWNLSPIQATYVLSHEMMHAVLCRDLGAVASHQFDGLYHRPLPCLGGRSVHEFELNRLHELYHDIANLYIPPTP